MVIIFIMSIYTKSAVRCCRIFSPGVFLPSGEFDFAAYRLRITQAGNRREQIYLFLPPACIIFVEELK